MAKPIGPRSAVPFCKWFVYLTIEILNKNIFSEQSTVSIMFFVINWKYSLGGVLCLFADQSEGSILQVRDGLLLQLMWHGDLNFLYKQLSNIISYDFDFFYDLVKTKIYSYFIVVKNIMQVQILRLNFIVMK